MVYLNHSTFGRALEAAHAGELALEVSLAVLIPGALARASIAAGNGYLLENAVGTGTAIHAAEEMLAHPVAARAAVYAIAVPQLGFLAASMIEAAGANSHCR
jgi:hypothetical protein